MGGRGGSCACMSSHHHLDLPCTGTQLGVWGVGRMDRQQLLLATRVRHEVRHASTKETQCDQDRKTDIL
jgi:hypothetical protein